MDERRQSVRDRVLYGGVAALDEGGATRDCVVRNLSEGGAKIEFGATADVPKVIGVTIARKSRSYLAKVVWWRTNTVGVAFTPDTPSSDLAQRLRRSEARQRRLKHRIQALTGED